MDTHWGKYQGPLAALCERIVLDGTCGDDSWSNSDIGEGIELWKGPWELSWSDAKYLRGDDFGCSDDELDTLDKELGMAQGIAYAWDSQGFQYAWTMETVEEYREQLSRITGLIAEEEGGAR